MRLCSSFLALLSHAVAERIGIHNTDIETMDLLNVLGPMTAGQLSEQTGLTSGATTRLIDRLENAGLVRRVSDPSDRRRVIIEPIEKNAARVNALYVPLAQEMGRIWSQFSDEEVAVILRFFRESNAVIARENTRLRGEMD
jgi:DNA-binding MarR family transcriptional regulator